MKAIVMAGGEGTRLRPLTSNQPKPMVPIVGKPCMEHIVELLKEHGFEDVIITVAFLPQAIRSYFGDGESLGVNISYSVEETPLGTAGSVRLATRRLDEPILVISGDALCDVDLRAMLETHCERGAAVTIGLKSVDNPLEFGIVVTDEDGRIERFLEKPSWGQVFSDTINTGIYILEPEVLTHIPDDGPYDFSKELSRWAGLCSATSSTATGRTSGTSSSTARRTPTRSTSVFASTCRGSACAETFGSARASTCTTSARCKGRRSSATTAGSSPRRPSARTPCCPQT
jgi:UTP-glucose-1-phosphate uridylyltransferase